jgi:hypothetical protein
MNSQVADELRQFHAFLGEKLKNGGADLTPEDALEEWRVAHPDSVEFEDDTAAIQEALDDMAAGDRGRPADEVIAELRAIIKDS